MRVSPSAPVSSPCGFATRCSSVSHDLQPEPPASSRCRGHPCWRKPRPGWPGRAWFNYQHVRSTVRDEFIQHSGVPCGGTPDPQAGQHLGTRLAPAQEADSAAECRRRGPGPRIARQISGDSGPPPRPGASHLQAMDSSQAIGTMSYESLPAGQQLAWPGRACKEEL